MNLIQLVDYFRSDGNVEKFFGENSIDPECEVVEIYMSKPFEVGSEIACFEIEKTKGNAVMQLDGKTFYSLFDWFYLMDFIEETKHGDNQKLTDKELSEMLLSYAIDDA